MVRVPVWIRTGFAGGVCVAVCEFGIYALMLLFRAYICFISVLIIVQIHFLVIKVEVEMHTYAYGLSFATRQNLSNYLGCNLLIITANTGTPRLPTAAFAGHGASATFRFGMCRLRLNLCLLQSCMRGSYWWLEETCGEGGRKERRLCKGQ